LTSTDPPLSWRDFFLIPGVMLLTVALLVGVSELVCRVLWADYESFACSVGDGNKPNCVMRMKTTEGKEYEYGFNECGFRSTTSCLTKAPGEFRLVTMGTSIGLGLYVSEEDFFATRAETELSRALHRPVDAQNMGAMVSTLQIPGKIARALALQPNAIVREICPVDLLIAYEDVQHKAAHPNPAPAQPAQMNLQGQVRIGCAVAGQASWHNTCCSATMTFYTSRIEIMALPMTRWGHLRHPPTSGTANS
jgi:hypothetical protein